MRCERLLGISARIDQLLLLIRFREFDASRLATALKEPEQIGNRDPNERDQPTSAVNQSTVWYCQLNDASSLTHDTGVVYQ